ncbi:dipeptidase [Paracoccus saliphilus]|uniref:Membrane dipeptidase n=1 Tax=Paracoccus saliphilus TaxID=405559 RepID=A0AA46A5I1_9RHOB|nr:membrane dipeptidase [Paracoccus saliphilus]WCR04205.1 membrane dipeptidase [Paracoccus saliphilus]SIS81112.1 Zn-dependent dipeptidase, dipeptidase homolog [Paracoccus saliphilus]
MLKRILLGIVALAILATVAFFIFAPGYVERSMNPVTMPEEGWPVSEEAEALHRELAIGDWHADSLLWDRDLLKRGTRGHTDIPRLLEGNVALQVYTTVTKSPRGQNYDQNSAGAPDNITPLFMGQLRPIRSWFSLRERALVQAEDLQRMAEETPDRLRIIRTREDLADLLKDRAGGEQVLGVMLGSEGGHPLEGELANLDALYDAGFRLMGLTHFFDNELGGSLHGEGGGGAGLTEFGYQVVEAMIAKGMVIDLAHASPQMVEDVLAIEGARPILSHTGIQGHCDSHRNLDDALVRRIADKGGVIGIGYWADVVCGRTPDDIASAIEAAIALVGEDHVSLGSDYDGSVDAPFDAAHLSALTQALMDAGLSEARIAKVMGGNMMRYLADVLPSGT